MRPLVLLLCAEGLLLGAGVALVVVGPAPEGEHTEKEAVEAAPRFEIPQEAFVMPSRDVLEWKYDINTASAEELSLIPGIGPATARKIVEDRERNGPYASLEDVKRVKGFGPALVRKLEPYATAGGAGRIADPAASSGGGVNLNTASIDELTTLPGIGKTRAEAIIAGRPYRSVDDLEKVRGIGPSTIERLRPLVTF